MKAHIRIPTTQYGYIEAEVEGDPEFIKEAHDTLLQLFTGGEGLPTKEFNALLDRYLRDGDVVADDYARLNKEQNTIIQAIKRSIKRINYGDTHTH